MADAEQSKHAGGRPLEFQTVGELGLAIQQYFDMQDPHIEHYQVDAGRKPNGETIWETRTRYSDQKPYTSAGLARALGMDRRSLLNYKNRDEFFPTVQAAMARLEEYAETQLFSPYAAGAKFSLANNFKVVHQDWSDRQELTGRDGKDLMPIGLDAAILTAGPMAQLRSSQRLIAKSRARFKVSVAGGASARRPTPSRRWWAPACSSRARWPISPRPVTRPATSFDTAPESGTVGRRRSLVRAPASRGEHPSLLATPLLLTRSRRRIQPTPGYDDSPTRSARQSACEGGSPAYSGCSGGSTRLQRGGRRAVARTVSPGAPGRLKPPPPTTPPSARKRELAHVDQNLRHLLSDEQ